MTPIVDCHTHTFYSDGQDSPEANVAAAEAAGCKVLVATDHLTLPAEMDPKREIAVHEEDLSRRAADFAAAAERHPSVEVVYGFECDWYEGCEANTERWSSGAVVRLGSIHWVGGRWIDDVNDLSIWEDLGADEVWRRYVDAWCTACASPLNFDTMAHPDLAARFRNEGYPATMDLTPLYKRMAECAHDTHRRIEVSTAGLRKTVGGYYPTPELLRAFKRAEVPITVGSDAHTSADIAWGIRDAYAYAAAAGYREIEVPHADGSWETMPLE